jgi:hypothetical protein
MGNRSDQVCSGARDTKKAPGREAGGCTAKVGSA